MQNENQTKPSAVETIISYVIAIAIYTCIGVVAGLFYSVFAPALSIPVLSIGPFLALWWFGVLAVGASVVLFVTVFRATDPISKVYQQELNKKPTGFGKNNNKE